MEITCNLLEEEEEDFYLVLSEFILLASNLFKEE